MRLLGLLELFVTVWMAFICVCLGLMEFSVFSNGL